MTEKFETVAEISALLGVKPARTYQLARLWEASGGKAGVPCIRLGRMQLRFSRAEVEAFLTRQIIGERHVREELDDA